METNKNKLTGFIIIFLFLALGCEEDSYETNREEFSSDLSIDRTAPTASVTTAIIKNTGSVLVQSTEKGTAYLVNTTVTVSNLASIRGAADNKWNSVFISSASTNTSLEATGLADGTYKVYAVDTAFNLSSASTNSVAIDTTAPTANFTAATDNVGTVTGPLTSGNTTDDTDLVLTGTNESGSGVKVYNGSTELGEATVSGTSWSYSATVANGTTYQFNVRETDIVGNTSDATSNFAVTGDTTAPTASVTTATITTTGNTVVQSTETGTVILVNTSATITSGNAVVQSTETGTVYLVNTTVTVSNLASITGAAVYQWNSVAISSASTNTSLSVAGIVDGTYKAYAVDDAGNLSSASSNSVTVDSGTPTIISVAITSATGIQNSFLNAGDVVSVTVTFTESVIVASGTPTLTLVVGSTNRTATYTSGTGGALVFQYTIQAGETDDDGISIGANALALNNATIRDAVGHIATHTHSAVSANTSYKVDTTAPTVNSFTISDTALKAGETMTVELVFSEAVAYFSSAADINLDNATGLLSTMSSSNNITWTGTFTPTADMEVASNTLSLATSYTDPAGNNGPAATTSNYAIETLVPSVSSIVISSATGIQNSFLNAGDVVSVTATFSESVIVASGTPTLTLVVGSTDRTATYASGSGSTQLVFQYTIKATGTSGENDINGISIGADALALNSGTIRDAAGNNATLTHSAVSDNTSYKVDTTLPTVSSVAITSATGIQNSFLNAGDVVSVTATFSESVIVDNSSGPNPTITLVVGSDNRTATYMSHDNATLVFRYTIQDNETDSFGISIPENALALNNATIRDAALNNATLTHSAVDNNSSYKVDTTAPTVNSFTISDTLLTIGETMAVTLEFSEPICVSTSECTRSQTNAADPYFSNADITIPNLDSGPRTGVASGTLTTMISDDNETWRGTFTPATDAEDNSSRLSLATTYTDLAGNNGPDNQTENYEVETRAPTVSVAFSSELTEGRQTLPGYSSYGWLNEGDNVSVTATFSERVTVDNSSGPNPTITLVVGSDNRTATYMSHDNATLVFRYTIQAQETDSFGISIPENALDNHSSTIRDVALNYAILTHSADTDNDDYIVDTTPPTVSSVAITSVPTGRVQYNFLNANDVAEMKVTFSESPISAVIVDNPSAATLTLKVGNEDNRTAIYNRGSGTVVSSAGGDNASLYFRYTIQATNTSGENDDDGISIVANALNSDSIEIRDAAGNIAENLDNSVVPDNSNYKVDTIPPAVDNFTMSDIKIKKYETAAVTLEFSEPICAVSGTNKCATVFTAAAISHPSGNLPTMSSSQAEDNKTSWTGTFTPTDNHQDDINRLVLNTSYTDLAGNNGPDNRTAIYDVDTKAPSATFFISDTTLRLTDNATVDLVFSEEIVGFSSDDDITIPDLDQGPGQGRVSGTLSTMISSDNKTWTGTFMPTFPDTEDWSNRLELSDNYTDIDNNTGTAATSPNYMIDDIYPHTKIAPTLTLDSSLILYGETATLTLVFPEPITTNYMSDNTTSANSFDGRGTLSSVSSPGDIDLDNATGTLATMEPLDDDNKTTWAGTFTPTADMEVDNNTITLGTSWTDQVGNPMTGASVTTSNFEVETLRPVANNLTFSVTQGTTYNGTPGLKIGDNATLTVVFSEPVVAFSSANITHPYVNLDNMTSSDNITWTGTFTPENNVQLTTNQSLTLNTSYTDIVGNSAYNEVNSSNYVVDTRAPSVSSLQFTVGTTPPLNSPFTDRCLPVTGNIIVTFDGVMDLNYIQTNTSDTICTSSAAGSLLVSSDNFTETVPASSCVRMSSVPSASNLNQTFTLDPYGNLSYDTTYKVRVTTGVKDVLGNNMSSQYDYSNGFKTSSYPSSSPISGVFVGVGQYGKEVRSIDNGTSWDNETCQILTDLDGVAFGNNTFVAVGQSGKIVRSTDNGTSFSTVTPVDNTNLDGVAFGNNTFVAVGDSGKIVRSMDNGSTFSAVTSGISTALYGATFGNNNFVGVGLSGKILRSTDNGSSWNNSTSPITSSLFGVSFGNNNFVGVGQNGKIVRSTDNGTTWDNSTSGISTALYGATFGNNTFVAVGSYGKIVRSTDNGSSWDNSTSGILSTLNGVTFGNNTFVAVGDSGKILRSTDNGSSWDNSTSTITTHLKGVTFSE